MAENAKLAEKYLQATVDKINTYGINATAPEITAAVGIGYAILALAQEVDGVRMGMPR